MGAQLAKPRRAPTRYAKNLRVRFIADLRVVLTASPFLEIQQGERVAALVSTLKNIRNNLRRG
jgi:hypothetical protein